MTPGPIFNGLPGESVQDFIDRSTARFERFMREHSDWTLPALNRERDRADSSVVGLTAESFR